MIETVRICDICGKEINPNDDYEYRGPEKSDRIDLRDEHPIKVELLYRHGADSIDLCLACAKSVKAYFEIK